MPCLQAKRFLGVLLLAVPAFGLCASLATQAAQTPVNSSIETWERRPDFTSLVRLSSPSIVQITTRKTNSPRHLPAAKTNFPVTALRELLSRYGLADERPALNSMTSGSGFIIDDTGHILTSAHVVDGVDEVMVRLSDQRQFPAKVLGYDTASDIALLKISSSNLSAVKIGDPEALEVGEWVFAIGAPFGLSNTVTQGIVSAKGRDIPNENIIPFIQTDAAINPGNSGGPLLNMKGEVVGINALIYSHSGGYMGVSFAIPIDVALQIKDKLLRDGHIRRGRLGVVIQEMTPALAQAFRLAHPQGALIVATNDTPGVDLGGLAPGDIVLEFNRHRIGGTAELSRQVAESAPGVRLPVKFWRAGKAMETQVTLIDAASRQPVLAPSRMIFERFGLVFLELTRTDRQAMGTEGGVMIEAVDGPAATSGLLPGDIVLAVNNQRVLSLEQLQQEIKRQRKQWALLVERDGVGHVFIPLMPD